MQKYHTAYLCLVDVMGRVSCFDFFQASDSFGLSTGTVAKGANNKPQAVPLELTFFFCGGGRNATGWYGQPMTRRKRERGT